MKTKLTPAEKAFALTEHVGYELRMLLGAREVVQIADEHDLQNVCSIARDSIYLHTRVMCEFFNKSGESYLNIEMFGGRKVENIITPNENQALNNHTHHLTIRRMDSNTNDVDLPKIAINLANRIEKEWMNWISYAKPELKTILEEILSKATTQATNDKKSFLLKLTPLNS